MAELWEELNFLDSFVMASIGLQEPTPWYTVVALCTSPSASFSPVVLSFFLCSSSRSFLICSYRCITSFWSSVSSACYGLNCSWPSYMAQGPANSPVAGSPSACRFLLSSFLKAFLLFDCPFSTLASSFTLLTWPENTMSSFYLEDPALSLGFRACPKFSKLWYCS